MTNFKFKTSKYRVTIVATPVWKIEAISKYKTRLIKKTRKTQVNGTYNIIGKVTSVNSNNAIHNDHDKSTASHCENVNYVIHKGENVLEATQKVVMINNVNVIEFTKFNEVNEIRDSSDQTMNIGVVSSQLNITVEQIETELQNLVTNSESVKKEVSCLNNVRCALLWLLKKTSNYGTYRNHSLI